MSSVSMYVVYRAGLVKAVESRTCTQLSSVLVLVVLPAGLPAVPFRAPQTRNVAASSGSKEPSS